MKKIKTLTCVVLMALLIMTLMALSAFAITIPAFTVSPSSQLQIVLPAGTTFNGSISITGTLRFWVSDPNGAQIINLGLIDKPTAFGFVAQHSGNYTLNFENDVPHSDPIQVSFSYTTNPDISGSGNSTGISLVYLAISIIITVLGSILIIFLVHRKTKKQRAVIV
jgi:hypothetical protein